MGRPETNAGLQTPAHPKRSLSRPLRFALVALAAFSLSSHDEHDTITDAATWVKHTLTPLPSDPYQRALALLQRNPLIDGHLDVPILARAAFRNQISEIDLNQPTRGQIDVPRLRAGGVGGFFWSVYVPCPEDAGFPKENEGNFTTPTWRTRDTLEQIDIARLIIEKHSDTFEFTPTAKSWRKAMKKGKIGGMLGVEGGHQLGNSLSSLRTYYALGARYLTLTHTCHNALADSCGYQGSLLKPRWGGLSEFGKIAVKEMNRLGMILDISHTDPTTASDALTYSLSPPIFSHSNSRGIHAAVRNVADSTLVRIGNNGRKGPSPALELLGEGGKGWGNGGGGRNRRSSHGDAPSTIR